MREGAPRWVFYEGPPTANGPPGSHHVLSRVFKDIYPRYQTMRGKLVERKGGWDCHGLPVEIAVEQQLGITTKAEIEEMIGIERFNAACRESVFAYLQEWNRLTERIGFWIDLDDAYRTLDESYIESVWWALAQIDRRELLYEGHKVVPVLPALRARAVLARGRARATGTWSIRVGVCAPAGAGSGRAPAAREMRCWSGRRRRGRCRATSRSRSHPSVELRTGARRRGVRPRRGARRAGAGRGRGDRRPLPRQQAGGPALRRADLHTPARRADIGSSPGTSSRPRTARARAHRPGVRRGRLPGGGRGRRWRVRPDHARDAFQPGQARRHVRPARARPRWAATTTGASSRTRRSTTS